MEIPIVKRLMLLHIQKQCTDLQEGLLYNDILKLRTYGLGGKSSPPPPFCLNISIL